MSAAELIQHQQAILLKNAENQKLRQRKDQLGWNATKLQSDVDAMKEKLRLME